VAVLEKYGVDTRGLIPLEHSVDEDTSAIHADIADAVAQLGEKLDLAKAAVSRREISKSEKMAELEGKLAQQAADLEESMALRVTLEKRLEVLKASAKSAREGSATATLEIEALQAKVKELKDELSTAHKRVVSSTEVVSSEVQALEEENIELLKENKELRLQVSRLKANPAAASAPIAPAPVAAASVFSPAPKAAASASSGALSGSKRAFGTDISNTAPTSTVKASQGDVAKPTAAGMSQSEPDDAVKAKSRRTRVKAKAMVDESMKPQDEAGECKQS
jgi:archaellum component FlaC